MELLTGIAENILVGVVAIVWLAGFYIMYRNQRAYSTRIKILNEMPIDKGVELYAQLPSYSEMVYSFKPLSYNYWYNYCQKRLYESYKHKKEANL